jgi:hypothetical protein
VAKAVLMDEVTRERDSLGGGSLREVEMAVRRAAESRETIV